MGYPTGTAMVLGTTMASKDNATVQGMQVQMSQYQVRSNVSMFALHGIISRPLPGAQVAILHHAGDPGNAVGVGVNDPRYYLSGLADGVVGVAHHLGAHVLFFEDRIEVDGGGNKVIVQNASGAELHCDVKIFGKLDVTGEVKAQCDGDSVTLSQHRGHKSDGGPPTPGT